MFSSTNAKVKRTYSSRGFRNLPPPSSPQSTLSSSPPQVRKRPLERNDSLDNLPPSPKRVKLSKQPKSLTSQKEKPKQKTLTQLHFCIDQPVFRACTICDMSYIKGAPDDEALHKSHCARVQRGMEWGKEEERDTQKGNLTVIARNVVLKNKKLGRIIRVQANATGKIGSKLNVLFETINLSLSAPPMTTQTIRDSKVYLFLLPSSTSTREKIVGCVVAQRISTAMAIASPNECILASSRTPNDSRTVTDEVHADRRLVAVDSSTGIFCYPEPLPTPLGVPRLFVAKTHRRLGIASKLLSAAAETFIPGCVLDPAKGDVAFSQPTGDGNAVMKSWGGGGVRIYEE